MRTFTAAAAGIAALWAVAQGIDIVRFAAVGMASANDSGVALEPFARKAGLASAALSAMLRAPGGPDALEALHRREDLLTRYLGVRPLASQDWASLAATRNALAATPASIDSAFLMSALTGPNEADVMAQRALSGLVMWERASAESRDRALIDLCGLNVTDPSRLRLVLSAKSTTVRAEIRAGLIAQRCAARLITALGL